MPFVTTHYAGDLRKVDVEGLVIPGADNEQIVPIGNAGLLATMIIPRATLDIREGAAHGLAATHHDRLNADLLAFACS